MELVTERLILRPLHQDDELAFFPLYNTPEVHHPKSPRVPEARQKELFRLLVQQPPLLSPYVVLAIVNATSTCIGLLFLTVHQVPKSQESLGVIGIVISNEWQDKGYGTEACQAALPFLFEERQVTRVMMGCRKANLSCQGVIEKLRLQPIAISRRAALVASGWVAPDELWYELLSTDKGTILA
jgi:RimJ/RimL family protein N-acetyltransferase